MPIDFASFFAQYAEMAGHSLRANAISTRVGNRLIFPSAGKLVPCNRPNPQNWKLSRPTSALKAPAIPKLRVVTEPANKQNPSSPRTIIPIILIISGKGYVSGLTILAAKYCNFRPLHAPIHK